jgi:hypothetical protein
MFKRQTAFALDTFLQGEGRGAGARKASLDSHGMRLIRNARHAVKNGVSARL